MVAGRRLCPCAVLLALLAAAAPVSSQQLELNGFSVVYGSIFNTTALQGDCVHLLLEADGFEGATDACATTGQQLQYALLLPGSGSSQPPLGRLTVTQQAPNAPSSFRWQRFLRLDSTALQLDIDMGDAQAVPVLPKSCPRGAAPVQLTAIIAAAAAAPLVAAVAPQAEKSPVPAMPPAAAAEAEEAAMAAAWDRSVPRFLQLAHPTCPAPAAESATGGSDAHSINNGNGSLSGRALSAVLPPQLAMWVQQQLRREEVALGISAACVLELLLIAGLALLCSCRPQPSGPPPAAPPQQHQGASLPLPAGHGTPQKPKPALRDACCSPMPAWRSPAALLQALRSPAAWGRPRRESIQEEDEASAEQGADRQQEAVGWTRDDWGRLQRFAPDPVNINLVQRHPAPFGSATQAAQKQAQWV